MIKSITVTNHLGETLLLELASPEKTGYIVVGCDGLSLGAATISASEFSSGDGSKFNSARIPSRNIVLSLLYMFNPNMTIEELRHKAYRIFNIKKIVTLRIVTDTRVCEIKGVVESHEASPFTEQEGSQISIICHDPYFYDGYGDQVTNFSDLEPVFEFPFGDQLYYVMTNINHKKEKTLLYNGEFSIGTTWQISITGNVNNITIHDLTNRTYLTIDTSILQEIIGEAGLKDKDVITLSTVSGNKYATLLRDGMYINILSCIKRGSAWFQLDTGENVFSFTAESGQENINITVYNRIAYGGI